MTVVANDRTRQALRKQSKITKTTLCHPSGGESMNGVDWHAALAMHDRWLRTVVLARIGQQGAVDRSAIDEVMQEVALAAVRQQAPLSDAAKLAPWLYRLAVTQALLYRRRLGRGRKLTARYAERQTVLRPESREPLDWLLCDERRALVRDALTDLPGRDAEMLLLKYTEGWSYAQLGAHLGISHSAVEARLHRARERLRQLLAECQVVAVEDG